MESGSRDGVHDPVLNDDPIDLGTEPEVLRWLTAYALADPAERDGTVGDVLTEVNLLLRRYRLRDAQPAAAYEAHARVLVDQMPGVLWSTDAELRVTSLAGGGLARVGARPASHISTPIAELLGTDDPSAPPLAAHARALRGESDAFDAEWRGRTYSAYVEPLRDRAGAIVGVVGAALDITERRRAEEALARREGQLAKAQQLARIGSWEWHAGETAATWSRELYRIWGLDPHTFLPTVENIQARVHPNDHAAFHAIRESAFRAFQTSDGEFRIIRPDDEVRHLSVLLTATCDADGHLASVHGACQDITERMQADEAARTTQRMLAHLLECFPNGAISVLDADLRYVMAAGRVLAELGLTPEDMIGRTHTELYPPAVVAAVEEPFRRALAGETVTGNVPLGDRTYTLSAAPLDQADGVVRTIIVVGQDITERVRAERVRTEQRERRARLDGMLFAVRELASRVNRSLVPARDDGDGEARRSGAASLDEAIDAAAALSRALEDIAELQRLAPPDT